VRPFVYRPPAPPHPVPPPRAATIVPTPREIAVGVVEIPLVAKAPAPAASPVAIAVPAAEIAPVAAAPAAVPSARAIACPAVSIGLADPFPGVDAGARSEAAPVALVSLLARGPGIRSPGNVFASRADLALEAAPPGLALDGLESAAESAEAALEAVPPTIGASAAVSSAAPAAALGLAAQPPSVSTESPFDPEAGLGLGPDPRGRIYPFVTPSDDVRHLLAEMALTFDAEDYRPPLRVVWFSGIGHFFTPYGGLPGSPPIYSPFTPQASPSAVPDYARVNPVDFVIWDADDEVVFDSTGAEYAGSPYGKLFHCHRWTAPRGVLRVTQNVKFRSPEEAYAIPEAVKPRNGILDERVGEVACRRVTHLEAAGAGTFAGEIRAMGGHNVKLSSPGPRAEGVRAVSELAISAAPGSGLGTYPDCDSAPAFSSFGGAQADGRGSLRLSGDGCYWFRPVVEETEDGPVVLPGMLRLGNDCGPCCECEDYATLAELTRDKLADGILRWKKLAAGPAVSVQFKAVPFQKQWIECAIQVCNGTTKCLQPFTLQVQTIVVATSPAPPPIRFSFAPDSTYLSNLCGDMIPTRPSMVSPPWLVDTTICDGLSPCIFFLTWDMIQPMSNATAKFRYAFTAVDPTVPTMVDFTLDWQGGTYSVPIVLVPAGEE